MKASYKPSLCEISEEQIPGSLPRYIYELTEDEGGYGVLLKSAESGAVLYAVRSVSLDEGRVRAFVSLCNRLSLSAAHFYDVLEDFVS